MKTRISSTILLCALVAPTFASHTPSHVESAPVLAPSKFYVGIFGGGGSSNKINVNQYATAYLLEASGGPLAVDAFGTLNSESSAFFGLQLGYQMQEILLSSTPSARWTLSPAIELEGYGMNNSSFNAAVVNNTDRLDAHDFAVTYPMSRNVFLGNMVIGFNNPCLMVHPYIGFGIGSALMRITGATAIQTDPLEAGLNHYNSNSNASDSAFAGQIKLGLSYDFNQYVSVFADYRWLYIASSSFVFGSTVVPGHSATSSWQVSLDAQKYNLANLGLRFNLS